MSYDRRQYTENNLYSRNIPVSVIDTQQTQKELSNLHKQKFKDLKSRLNFATSLNNAKFYKHEATQKHMSEVNDISLQDADPSLTYAPHSDAQSHALNQLQAPDHRLPNEVQDFAYSGQGYIDGIAQQ